VSRYTHALSEELEIKDFTFVWLAR
jgi:hypothetical protein